MLDNSDLSEIRARAAAHARDVEARAAAYTMRQLATRWACSVESVRQIPPDRLPYVPIGAGHARVHRRYLPEAVAAYERHFRAPGGAAA